MIRLKRWPSGCLIEEHKLYSLVIGAIAARHISIDDGRISAKPGAISGTVAGVPALIELATCLNKQMRHSCP